MFGLYRAVTSRGGFIDRPHARKNLSMVEVFREMDNHYEGHTYTDIGTLLLNTYQKTFSEYEDEHPQDRNVVKCDKCDEAPSRDRKTGFGCESAKVVTGDASRDWCGCAECGVLTHTKCCAPPSAPFDSTTRFKCDACRSGATAKKRDERRRARDAIAGGGAGNRHAAGRRDREREKRDREKREADKVVTGVVNGVGACVGVVGKDSSKGSQGAAERIHQPSGAGPAAKKRSRGGEQIVFHHPSRHHHPGGGLPNVEQAVAEAMAAQIAEESADRRRADAAVSAAAAHAVVAGAAPIGHGFSRDFGYHGFQHQMHQHQHQHQHQGNVTYGTPQYVQGYSQMTYNAFPQQQQQQQQQRGAQMLPPGSQQWQSAAAQTLREQDECLMRAFNASGGAKNNASDGNSQPLNVDPQWVRYSPDGTHLPSQSAGDSGNDTGTHQGTNSGLNHGPSDPSAGSRGGSSDRMRRMVLQPDGGLVETTEGGGLAENTGGDSGPSPGSADMPDSADPGMSVLTSLATAPGAWMPSASEANLLQRLNDELKETRAGASPRSGDVSRKGSDPRLVISGEMRGNPSLTRFGEMERSDSLCSLGVYDSQYWNAVLDNGMGMDGLGSDPAA